MAKASVKLPDDLLIQLSHLGEKTDEVTEKMLNAGADVVAEEMKKQLSSVLGKDTKYPSRSTGQLLASIGKTPVSPSRKTGDLDIKIGFDTHREDGTTNPYNRRGGNSNAMVANILEYGKSNQPAKPFVKRSKNRSKKACSAKMAEVFDEEVKKYVHT